MKYQTTKKDVVSGHSHCIKVGYCDLQNLLNCGAASAYTCGVYGWNADIYDVSYGACIVTGHRPFGDIAPSYEVVSTYNNRAKEIRDVCQRNREDARPKLAALLDEFVVACLKEASK